MLGNRASSSKTETDPAFYGLTLSSSEEENEDEEEELSVKSTNVKEENVTNGVGVTGATEQAMLDDRRKEEGELTDDEVETVEDDLKDLKNCRKESKVTKLSSSEYVHRRQRSYHRSPYRHEESRTSKNTERREYSKKYENSKRREESNKVSRKDECSRKHSDSSVAEKSKPREKWDERDQRPKDEERNKYNYSKQHEKSLGYEKLSRREESDPLCVPSGSKESKNGEEARKHRDTRRTSDERGISDQKSRRREHSTKNNSRRESGDSERSSESKSFEHQNRSKKSSRSEHRRRNRSRSDESRKRESRDRQYYNRSKWKSKHYENYKSSERRERNSSRHDRKQMVNVGTQIEDHIFLCHAESKNADHVEILENKNQDHPENSRVVSTLAIVDKQRKEPSPARSHELISKAKRPSAVERPINTEIYSSLQKTALMQQILKTTKDSLNIAADDLNLKNVAEKVQKKLQNQAHNTHLIAVRKKSQEPRKEVDVLSSSLDTRIFSWDFKIPKKARPSNLQDSQSYVIGQKANSRDAVENGASTSTKSNRSKEQFAAGSTASVKAQFPNMNRNGTTSSTIARKLEEKEQVHPENENKVLTYTRKARVSKKETQDQVREKVMKRRISPKNIEDRSLQNKKRKVEVAKVVHSSDNLQREFNEHGGFNVKNGNKYLIPSKTCSLPRDWTKRTTLENETVDRTASRSQSISGFKKGSRMMQNVEKASIGSADATTSSQSSDTDTTTTASWNARNGVKTTQTCVLKTQQKSSFANVNHNARSEILQTEQKFLGLRKLDDMGEESTHDSSSPLNFYHPVGKIKERTDVAGTSANGHSHSFETEPGRGFSQKRSNDNLSILTSNKRKIEKKDPTSLEYLLDEAVKPVGKDKNVGGLPVSNMEKEEETKQSWWKNEEEKTLERDSVSAKSTDRDHRVNERISFANVYNLDVYSSPHLNVEWDIKIGERFLSFIKNGEHKISLDIFHQTLETLKHKLREGVFSQKSDFAKAVRSLIYKYKNAWEGDRVVRQKIECFEQLVNEEF